MCQAFNCKIVQVDVGDDSARALKRLFVHSVAMILGGDVNASRPKVFDGMVATAMTEL
jgi:hypothetical protein